MVQEEGSGSSSQLPLTLGASETVNPNPKWAPKAKHLIAIAFSTVRPTLFPAESGCTIRGIPASLFFVPKN